MMIRALLHTKARIARNKIFSYRFHSRFKGVVIGLFLLIYLVGGYFLLLEGFTFVQGFPFIGDLLLDRIVDLFFFALFFMLVISQALFAYGSFFRSREQQFLKTLPLSSGTLFAWQFWEATFLSSWTFLFVSIPMLIAYAQVRQVFLSFTGLFLLLFIPMVMIAGVCGALVPFCLVRVWRSRQRWIFAAGLAGIAAAVWAFSLSVRSRSMVEPVLSQILDKLLWHTRFVQWPWWPSQWVSSSILGFLKGEMARGLGMLWFLWITAVFFVQGLLAAGGRLLEASARWEPRRRKNVCPPARMEWLKRMLVPWLDRQGAAVVVKDVKTFVRDPAQWSHFAVFFGLLAVYFFNLRNFRYDVMGAFWQHLVAFLNLATVGLVAATLSTRFFFPLPSLELRYRWVWHTGGSGKILSTKFAAGLVFLLLVTEVLMLASCRMLRLEGWLVWTCLAADFLLCVAMIGVSLGVGAVFPVPGEDVSAKIVSGFGGTLCLVLTLGYLMLVVLLLAVPTQLFVIHRAMSAPVYTAVMTGVWFFLTILSVGLSAVFLAAGSKALRNA